MAGRFGASGRDDGRWSLRRVGVASQRVDAIPELGVVR